MLSDRTMRNVRLEKGSIDPKLEAWERRRVPLTIVKDLLHYNIIVYLSRSAGLNEPRFDELTVISVLYVNRKILETFAGSDVVQLQKKRESC